jgi:hypothetical protein
VHALEAFEAEAKGRNDAREAFWARVEKGDSESGVGGTNNRVILAAVHAIQSARIGLLSPTAPAAAANDNDDDIDNDGGGTSSLSSASNATARNNYNNNSNSTTDAEAQEAHCCAAAAAALYLAVLRLPGARGRGMCQSLTYHRVLDVVQHLALMPEPTPASASASAAAAGGVEGDDNDEGGMDLMDEDDSSSAALESKTSASASGSRPKRAAVAAAEKKAKKAAAAEAKAKAALKEEKQRLAAASAYASSSHVSAAQLRKMLAASRLDGAARVVGELASSAAYLPLVMAGGASDDREALVRTVEVLVLAVASGGSCVD